MECGALRPAGIPGILWRKRHPETRRGECRGGAVPDLQPEWMGSFMEYTAELLCCDVIAAVPTDTVLAAVKMMKEAHTGCVVVIEGGRPVGVFSERDLLNRVVAESKDPAATVLEMVMTPGPVTLDASEPLENVFLVFAKHRFRHIPITQNRRLRGIVSLTDVARILNEVCKDPKYIQIFAASLAARSAKPA